MLVKRRNAAAKRRKEKFLCGHDEWFGAAAPDVRGVATIEGALEALKERTASTVAFLE